MSDSDFVRTARERGRRDYAAGVPYDHCPYLTFPDCPEGAAWQNAWLAARDEARGRAKGEKP